MPDDNRQKKNGDLVSVWTGNPAGANVVKATLEQHRINAIIIQKAAGGLMPPVVPEAVKVMVLEEDAARAVSIIKGRREIHPDNSKIKVLFVCTHNRFRSQMAEGFLRALGGGRFEVFSAGTNPRGPGLIVLRVMNEVGVDISGHTGNHVDEFLHADLDYVITVCDDAKEMCPAFPGGCERLHWSLGVPSQFSGTPEEIERRARTVRDEIGRRITEFVAVAKKNQSYEDGV